MVEGGWQPVVRTVTAPTRIGIMCRGRVAIMAGLAFINCVGLVSEFGRQPGNLAVTVAALPAIMIALGCVASSAVVQTDVIEIILKPAVGVGMAGIAGTKVMFCRSSMAFLAVAVSAVVESVNLPILGIRVTADAAAAVVVTVGRFGLVAGKALTDL